MLYHNNCLCERHARFDLYLRYLRVFEGPHQLYGMFSLVQSIGPLQIIEGIQRLLPRNLPAQRFSIIIWIPLLIFFHILVSITIVCLSLVTR